MVVCIPLLARALINQLSINHVWRAQQKLCTPLVMHIVLDCRFHSCHEAALQALYCLKARAEYELLPVSMQVMMHGSNVLVK